MLTGILSSAIFAASLLTAPQANADAKSDCQNSSSDAAIEARKEIIRRTPRDASGYYWRGNANRVKGDYDLAIADYTKALELNPKNVGPLINRAITHQTKGDYNSAFADATMVIERYCAKGLCSPYGESLAYVNRGIANNAKGDKDRAIADYTKALELNPKLPEAYTNRAKAYSARGEVDRAIADLDQAILLNSNDPSNYYSRGLSFINIRDFDRALVDLNEAIRILPNNGLAHLWRGSVWHARGEHDRAILDYDVAARSRPDDPAPFLNRANAWRDKGAYDHAFADYDEAFRRTSDPAATATIYAARAEAWQAKGDDTRMLADLSEAAKLEPNRVSHHKILGYAQFNNGDFVAAATSLLHAIDLKNEPHTALWRYLARSRAGANAADELAANTARFTSRDWPYPVIDFYLGRRDVKEMQSAAKTDGDRCEASFYLGQWQLLHNDRTAATQSLRAAEATCPKNFTEYAGSVAALKRLER